MQAGSCSRRMVSVGQFHDEKDRFVRRAPPAPGHRSSRDLGRFRLAVDDFGLFRSDALQWRREGLHRRLQEEPRPVIDIDLPDRLWAASVGVHEVGLLGQWAAKILRASQAIDSLLRRNLAFTNS